MRIALLSDCYLPRLGGIEVQTHDLASELARQGHHVEVFTATPGPDGERHGARSVLDGITVRHHAIRLPGDLPVNPFAPPAVRRELLDFDVAHIQTGVVSPFAWDMARVAMRIGIPTAMTWHCMVDRAEAAFRATGVIRRWAARGMAMSAVSTVAAAPVRSMVGRAGEVAVLPNGIDVPRWAPAPDAAPWRPEPGVLRMVTAMRLAARKRPVPLLRMLARARDLVAATGRVTPGAEGPARLELTVLGDGPDRRRVERVVRELRLDGGAAVVRLPGRVTREELRERYAASDLYLSPARLEAFGIAPLEARTVGLPVIGRAGSGVTEFVTDGVNGRIVASDDGFAAAMAELATDRATLERMRAHNVSTPPGQDWPAVARSALAEYERATRLRHERWSPR